MGIFYQGVEDCLFLRFYLKETGFYGVDWIELAYILDLFVSLIEFYSYNTTDMFHFGSNFNTLNWFLLAVLYQHVVICSLSSPCLSNSSFFSFKIFIMLYVYRRACEMCHVIWTYFLISKEVQDNADQYRNELDQLKSTLLRTEEEKKRLEDEVTQVTVFVLLALNCFWDVLNNINRHNRSLYWLQVKEMLKREVQKAENESNRNTAIITEYKQVKFPKNIK